ncbi:hypothetical protein FB567DRAFT_514177 [Paraphoma chrysanthemicola]|uniref:F-box domain-containing protein n=1 Tax=Paraphoma chrysanthemicola TaxID=798071 RepID=A0A8K0W2N3_9PLEO|nr:hypothetical protein FB567DRAFT_514177 [Paraphoma chrysanthemicola]
MASFDTLPNEILSLITSHMERPLDVLNLSLATRRLCEFAKLDGWKAFLKGRFGINGLDPDARNAVHGLTTLYRNWQRKGLIARYVEPAAMTTSINSWQRKSWRGPRGQTMGYQPSIDSYEEMLGAWEERREVLVWSAGTQIVVRVKECGEAAQRSRSEEQDASSADAASTIDAYGHRNSWFSYKLPDSAEGRDDIMSMKLLRPHQRSAPFEELVYGTASGQLSMLSWNTAGEVTRQQQYETAARSVGSISLSSASKPMIAAALGDSVLALYPVDRDTEAVIEPLSEVTTVAPGAAAGRIWSCNFLSDEKVATGQGPSCAPVQVHQITSDGFLAQPLRSFSLESKYSDGPRTGRSASRHTSVYPILPLPATAQGGSQGGNVFLSGAYDGIIRLHDLRSPHNFETLFWDPTNDSPVYSLATHGLERIVAGVSMHSMIKVFDLRTTGSHAYRVASSPARARTKPSSQDRAHNAIVGSNKHDASIVSGGWNLYLNPRIPPKRTAYREDYWRGGQDSPVYSLSIPSSTSQTIYAGLEGAVQSLTFHGTADPHPDPALSQGIVRFPETGVVDIGASYNPREDALDLGMYEQGSEEGLGMQLLVQDGVTTAASQRLIHKSGMPSQDLDERWKDLRDEGHRWTRGALPQGPTRGRGRGHARGRGGRGRGRGGGRGG